ncbi:hypothetical protein C8A01DRAFT_51019 [Parachaetomium inaequale]|uniref:Uncharacterized protein n=1 Tax=Parachaetomium inaequale TaxID=2588326 RepID=A0AAN6P7C8_9PEZI|nr:hypothetical protein C8A01DRAFT_51019 [Parachaetomium inaequale]
MADTYWDPANLLQITDSNTALEVQCLGRAKSRHNARCRWTLSGSDAAAIMAKVRKLATIPPTKVTQQELESLAKLCLCRDYHFSQWYAVAQRWKPALARAVKHHERLARGSVAAEKPQSENLASERKQCFKILGFKDDGADLPGKLSAYLRDNADAKHRIETTVAELQGDLAAAHVTICTSEDHLREMEGELHRAKTRETELTEECLAAALQVQESRKAKRARLAEMLKGLESANNDRGRLENVVAVLRDELGSATRWLEEERAKADSREEAEEDLKRRLVEAIEAAAQANDLLEEEKTKARELSGAKDDLERRLSGANKDIVSTRRRLEEEKGKAKVLRDKQEGFERRVLEAYAQGDRLVAEERSKGKILKQEKDDLEHHLHEVNVKSERLLYEEQTKNRILSDIRHELRLRLSEARASNAAEASKAKRDKDALSKAHATALDRVRRLQTSLDATRHRLQQLEDERQSFEQNLQQSRAEVGPLRSTNEQLRIDIAVLRNKITSLEETLSNRWRTRLRNFIHTHKPGHDHTTTDQPLSPTPLLLPPIN